jgi:hypothetical protein
MSIFNPLSNDPFSLSIKQHLLDKERMVKQLIKDYENGVDINDEDYLDEIDFFTDFSLAEQQEIIKEVNRRI